MNVETAKKLNELSQAFYAERAQEFSDTRRAGWPGWERCWKWVKGTQPACHPHCSPREQQSQGICPTEAWPLEIFDVACGNLRFETWWQSQSDAPVAHFTCVDSCRALLPDESPKDVTFLERDIVALLCQGDCPPVRFFMTGGQSPCHKIDPSPVPADAAVCFGFFHHVPGAEARVTLLDRLIASVRPGGIVALSLWRFADDEKMRAKAEQTTQLALARHPDLDLDADDYLLGFNETTNTFRYCHSFSDEEIDALLACASIPHRVLDRYRADGRTSALNEYLVLQRP